MFNTVSFGLPFGLKHCCDHISHQGRLVHGASQFHNTKVLIILVTRRNGTAVEIRHMISFVYPSGKTHTLVFLPTSPLFSKVAPRLQCPHNLQRDTKVRKPLDLASSVFQLWVHPSLDFVLTISGISPSHGSPESLLPFRSATLR